MRSGCEFGWLGPGPRVAAASRPLCVLRGLGMFRGQAAPSPCPSWRGACLLLSLHWPQDLALLAVGLPSPCGGPPMPESMASPAHRTPIGWCSDRRSGSKPRVRGAEMPFAEWASVGEEESQLCPSFIQDREGLCHGLPLRSGGPATAALRTSEHHHASPGQRWP